MQQANASPQQSSPACRTVLVVAPQPFYQDRGTPIAVRQLLAALSETGCAVDLLTYPVGAAISLPGLRILRTANPLGIRRVGIGLSAAKLVLDAALCVSLARLLARRRYDCIHAVEEAAFPAALLARLVGTPLVYDMQSSLSDQLARHPLLGREPVQRLLRRCERWLFERADLVVTSAGLSERVRAVAPTARATEWRFPSAPPRVGPEEVDALRRCLDIPRGAPVVLYGGSFADYQGLPALLEAVPLVRAAVPDAVFLLVGASGERDPLLDAARRDPALRVVDRQPRERMDGYLALADVLVSPRAHGNNVPLKIFDYLAAGRPIVATDLPTHRTHLDESRAVLVGPSGAALAGGIVRLLRDREEGARLAAAAARYAAQHLGWSGFVASVDALYASLDAPNGARAAVPLPPDRLHGAERLTARAFGATAVSAVE